MTRILFTANGGNLVLPVADSVLVDREDGGHLIVDPPRAVWDRTALTPDELVAWNALVASAAYSMLDVLPQLDGGCINYWDAGNWALNDAAEPAGPKIGIAHRVLHMHLLGRSRFARSSDHRWGEAPRFPVFAERVEWARRHRPLSDDECADIVRACRARLRGRYRFELPGDACVAGSPG